MSPAAASGNVTDNLFEDNLDLSILGIGVAYPPYRHGPDALETFANRHYKPSIALTKVLSINRFTGIETRASVGEVDHPLVNRPKAPSIKELNDFFREEGVRMSVNACRRAINEWGGSVDDITHMVSTTCTNSANPGFDHYVRKELGIRSSVEKVLLHGIGCSGGLAAIRTASNLALGSSHRKKPARILVLACEISTLLVRSELDSIDEEQAVRIGVCLFSDCASACIVSNNIGHEPISSPVFDILGWRHDMIDGTENDLGFDVDPLGWKVVLTPQVPSLASAAVAPAFESLIRSIPMFASRGSLPAATDFDWALHPGGSTIITGVQKAMNLNEEQLLASFEIYVNYGNSSSATIMAVMDKLRSMGEGKKEAVACAFGPGISLEMMMLRRGPARDNSYAKTNGFAEMNGHVQVNGHADVNGHTMPNGAHETDGITRTHEVAEANGLLAEELD
ncbi:MAG: hypothetical protein Q9163_000723 [Psora crenata]